VKDLAIALCATLVGIGFMWAEAALCARPMLRRFVEARGYTLRKARWLPLNWWREVEFSVTLERGEDVLQGHAYVGGRWLGPLLSSRVTFDLDEGAPSV
jgi:hypothetical protein